MKAIESYVDEFWDLQDTEGAATFDALMEIVARAQTDSIAVALELAAKHVEAQQCMEGMPVWMVCRRIADALRSEDFRRTVTQRPTNEDR